MEHSLQNAYIALSVVFLLFVYATGVPDMRYLSLEEIRFLPEETLVILPRVAAESILVGIAVGAGVPAVGMLLEALKYRLFPVGVFAVGMGRERHRRLERWRWAVVIGFLVSLAASLIATNLGLLWLWI